MTARNKPAAGSRLPGGIPSLLAVVAVAAFLTGVGIGASGPVSRTVGAVSERVTRGFSRLLGRELPRPAYDAPAVIDDMPRRTPAPDAPPELRRMPGRPFVLIVIDDVGYYMPEFRELLPLHPDLTYSVLPNAPGTEEALGLLQADGRQYMLHMPMEYRGWPNPDPCPDCLLRSMPDEEITRRVREALVKVRPSGVNNHMGSALTSDLQKIRAALKPLAGTGLFFLDSRTIGSSKAYEVAIDLGIPALGRNVFLDDDPDEKAVDRQYQELLRLARRRGHAIAIGHPRPSTVRVLKRRIPELARESIDLVRPADYLARLRWMEPLARGE